MNNIVITLFALSGIFLLPLLGACIVAWCQEALRLFHYAIKTHKFDDIAAFSVYMCVSLGLLAVIVAAVDRFLL